MIHAQDDPDKLIQALEGQTAAYAKALLEVAQGITALRNAESEVSRERARLSAAKERAEAIRKDRDATEAEAKRLIGWDNR